jgi:tetratricopeptide (TPR) repeat protein
MKSRMTVIILLVLYIFMPMVQSEENAGNYINLADEKFKSGDYKEAAELYNIARSENDSLLNAWYGEGMSYYKMAKYKESDEICDQVLGDTVNNPSDLEEFEVLAGDCAIAYEKEEGLSLVNAGDEVGKPVPKGYAEGIKFYDNATKLNPNSTIAWNRKGIALAELGNYTGSILCFEKMIVINSSQAEAYSNMGASLDNLDNHTQALRCYDNATKLDPLLAEAWYNKAKTLALDLNLISDARDSYKKAIVLNPDLKGEQLTWLYVDIRAK